MTKSAPIAALRSALFTLSFYGTTVLACLLLYPFLWGPRAWLVRGVEIYLGVVIFWERRVLGLTYALRGKDNFPQGPFIMALKHQSAWETLKLALWVRDPAIVLKRELMELPLWGDFARKLKFLAVDRGGGQPVLDKMLNEARTAKAAGRVLCIFPQGTRVPPGERRAYKIGAAMLAHTLELPIVPVALNAGLFWRRGFWEKRGGTITVEVLPPIMPQETPAATRACLERVLEAASERLSLAAGGPPHAQERDNAML